MRAATRESMTKASSRKTSGLLVIRPERRVVWNLGDHIAEVSLFENHSGLDESGCFPTLAAARASTSERRTY